MVGSNSSCPFKGSVYVMAVFIGLPVSKPNKVLGSVYVEEIQNGGCISEGVACPHPPAMGQLLYFIIFEEGG